MGGRRCRCVSTSWVAGAARGPGLLLLATAMAACVDAAPEGAVSERSGPPAPLAACPVPPGPATVEEVANGLAVPWAIAPAPDGRLFVTERPGRIRVIEDGVLQDEPWYTLDVESREEAGLMGLALAPDFASSGHLFVVSSHLRPVTLGNVRGVGGLVRTIRSRFLGDRGTHLVNRVHRLTDRDGKGTEPTLWVDGLPTEIIHAGGALMALPDRHGGGLLLSLGDAVDPWRAQDPTSLRGTLLRIPSTEQPPPGNRLRPGDHLWAMGIRNAQGLGLVGTDAEAIVFTDHGPTGMDELNLLERGGNYGWPAESGVVDTPRFLPPLVEWTPALAPGGLATLPGDGRGGDPADRARVLVTGLGGQALVQVRVEREEGGGWGVVCQDTILSGDLGRLRAIAPAPDGGVFVGTSNRDGRGAPRDGDDRLVHVRWDP